MRVREAGKGRRAAARRSFCWRLVIFAKAPVAGNVKTRLARETGLAPAVRFARHCAGALLVRVAFDPRWETTLALDGAAGRASRFWPAWIARRAQGRGSLGERMQQIMDALPPGPVIIVGSDVPQLRPAHIATGFRSLGRFEAVFGPARDGGYWLVGLRRRPHVPRAFVNVRWSSAHALADTMENFAGRSVALLTTLVDVDDAQGLAMTASAFARRVLPADVSQNAGAVSRTLTRSA